jgi:O-antigen/teichoic acid export membrane protein
MIGVFILAVMMIGGDQIFKLVFQDKFLSFYPWGLISVFTAIFNGFIKTYSNLLINQQRPERFFWINVVNFVLVIVVSIVLLYIYPFTLIGPMWGRMLPSAFSFLVVLYFMIREFGIGFKKEFLKGIVSFCTPMLVYALFLWIVSYIDRFIIKHFLVDPLYVGIFDFGVKLTLMIDFVQMGLANTIQPKIYNIWKDNNLRESTTEVNRYYNGFTAITLLMIPVFVIVIPLLVPLVVRKEIYYQCFSFLPILCLGFASRGLFNLFLAPIFFFKKTKVLPKVFFFSAVFQIIISYLLIKNYGLTGAVWATFFIKPIQALLLYTESRKIFTFRINAMKLIYLPLFFIVMVILSSVFLSGYNIIMVSAVQFVIIGLMIFFIYKNELKQTLEPFLKLFGIKL